MDLPFCFLSPEMTLVLELTVKQQALLYITVQEQSNAQSSLASDPMSYVSTKSERVCVECVTTSVWLLWVCVYSIVYWCMWGEIACRGVNGGLRYSACCQLRHISPFALLYRYANPASSECRAPDQLQFIPLRSPSLSQHFHPSSLSPLSLFAVSILSLVLCLVLATLFTANAPNKELQGGEMEF